MSGKKYGLIIRDPKSKQKTPSTRPAIPKPAINLDDDDDDVEREIERQATTKKSNKDVEELQKKALEEDPTVFDYDAVYDDMKSKIHQPKVVERQQRQSRYVQQLMDKAKIREREHELVHERKLAKERSVDEHLYADKDRFVTGAYKRKLEEDKKWEMEEKLRAIREERDDVTKKSDITDFYFSLANNVAFGAADKPQVKKPRISEMESTATKEDSKKAERHENRPASATLRNEGPPSPSMRGSPSRSGDQRQGEAPAALQRSPEQPPHPNKSGKENPQPGEQAQPSNDQPKQDHHKKDEDDIAAAKARYLARKKAKEEAALSNLM